GGALGWTDVAKPADDHAADQRAAERPRDRQHTAGTARKPSAGGRSAGESFARAAISDAVSSDDAGPGAPRGATRCPVARRDEPICPEPCEWRHALDAGWLAALHREDGTSNHRGAAARACCVLRARR